ncbi:uncharacterized protein PFL1_03741 [Pseudozyma flocculosa PF-1]|uniref:ER membrane protein complex subunit 4 n=2 Tax=Pseudozyma flocculosa TaxID=84751 RepID=A0A5C3F387_9BASI|nr:uncharacterized protein PFL1_03741 [Pseudozyma flocculosa PF-1]EPQ28941.1 hypothetical protein PFL1_03741 [Pseudozyma flocculosa PF-1]SPO38570.1 related to EMC4 - member of a transmembrane complex required for efficient folding of proteins in the ER [Pseudozyma flocculosa]
MSASTTTVTRPLSAYSLNYPGAFTSSSKSKAVEAADPPGFIDPDAVQKRQSKAKASDAVADRADPSALKMAKAWELAYSPAKSLPMNAIMLYMSGGGVQIFSMMAVGMLITGPIKGVSGMNTAFARYASPSHSLLLPKAVFILCQLAAVALGLYKCWSMGLLPTESSDWLAWREPREPLEFTPIRPW